METKQIDDKMDDIKTDLENLRKKLDKELTDTDFSTIYQDEDILLEVPEYVKLIDLAENDRNIKKYIIEIEHSLLKKHKLTKISGDEDKNYYALKGEVYSSEGMLIEELYEEFIENDDLFCDYVNDKIFNLMKKNATKKMKSKEDEEYEY